MEATTSFVTESINDVTTIGFSDEGRKSTDVADLVEVSSDESGSVKPGMDVEEDCDVEEEDSDEEESEEEDSDEEEEEEDCERTRILEDMWNLKKFADFFRHPEKPVEVDGFAAGRSFFSRPDAPEVVSEDEELAQAFDDAHALKQLADAYLHPERPVEVDATACARNYFSQPWAPEQETFGQAEQRARVMEEVMELKENAVTYRHPEAPIDMEPATGMGRNYFQRASAPEQMDEEQTRILEEMKALKQLAVDYMHPEKPVEVDATACGRNYFARASAPEQEEDEYCDDREIINELKQLAVDYMHPEKPLVMDAAAAGRNYFTRASAPVQEADEYCDDREIILEEMKELKQLAVDYMHPEKPVEMDSTCARSFFDRPSATTEQDDAEETEHILQEMQALKKLAIDYMHPEKPVEIDPASSGRNYFTRPSALQQEDEADEEECDLILKEMDALKARAVDFMHPERSIVMDATASGRNYFSRPSAPEQEEDEYCDEREIILEEMKELKQVAADYMHPEKPVVMDSTASARSYFGRPSAPEQEEDAEERELILQELQSLKKLAVDYMHPERPVEMDPSASGRNYFSRPSAPEQEEDEYCDERDIILEGMKELKLVASDYMHPEKPLDIDATARARNYFSRPSAPEQYEEAEELEMILKEAALMKKNALGFMHPELPLVVYATATGRNYFTRPSAPEQEEDEYCDEREIILEEMKELKQVAADYMHPEKPVVMDSTASARSYFDRPSAPEQEDTERELILQELQSLKKLAVDYMHPERPVEMDPAASGRNYFSRPSAPEREDVGREQQLILQEMQALKKLAADYMHPERPVDVDATAFGRNYFGRASAPTQESFGEAEERAQALAEATALKKVAAEYAHPELPVVVDSTAFARCYFSRASAAAQDTVEESQERNSVLAEVHALKKLAVDYLHPEVSVKTTDPSAGGRNYFARASAAGVADHISTSGHNNARVENKASAEDYGHFEMDEEMFYDMRQSIVLPLPQDTNVVYPKFQSSKMSSEEEGKLSRSPSSVMLFTGAIEDDHPPLPTMG